jgi:hypothetical protein
MPRSNPSDHRRQSCSNHQLVDLAAQLGGREEDESILCRGGEGADTQPACARGCASSGVVRKHDAASAPAAAATTAAAGGAADAAHGIGLGPRVRGTFLPAVPRKGGGAASLGSSSQASCAVCGGTPPHDALFTTGRPLFGRPIPFPDGRARRGLLWSFNWRKGRTRYAGHVRAYGS